MVGEEGPLWIGMRLIGLCNPLPSPHHAFASTRFRVRKETAEPESQTLKEGRKDLYLFKVRDTTIHALSSRPF